MVLKRCCAFTTLILSYDDDDDDDDENDHKNDRKYQLETEGTDSGRSLKVELGLVDSITVRQLSSDGRPGSSLRRGVLCRLDVAYRDKVLEPVSKSLLTNFTSLMTGLVTSSVFDGTYSFSVELNETQHNITSLSPRPTSPFLRSVML